MKTSIHTFAKTVARALEENLIAAGANVHWVAVVGEDSIDPDPQVLWPNGDPMFNVMVQHGWSEGTLLYVYAQSDRYRPQDVKPLLRIKMLSGLKAALVEAELVFNFLGTLEPASEVTSG
jgi:hypothetical protein